MAALTAYEGIFDIGGLKPGQSLLVLNASGGVGSFAVQFAKACGCNVIGKTHKISIIKPFLITLFSPAKTRYMQWSKQILC